MISGLPAPYYERDGIAIYHGDSRKLLRGMPAASVDMIFTDPPYGHSNNNGDLIHRREAALGRLPCGKDSPLRARPIANDGPEANDLARLLFSESGRVLRCCCCCCCCCCCGGGPDPQFARWSLWMDEQLEFAQMIVWDKGPIGMGWRYRRSYETVLVGFRGPKMRWFDDSHRIENIIRPGGRIRKIIPQRKDHPTPKPPELAEHFIRLHTEPGELVLDPFAGGGSTLLAARRLGRRAIGFELSKRFCRLAARRLEGGSLSSPRPRRALRSSRPKTSLAGRG